MDRVPGLTLGASAFFILGLAVGTAVSGGEALAFWTAGLMVATAALVAVTASQAILSARLQAEQTRPFLVWDSYENSTHSKTHAVIVRNVGRMPARILEVKYDGQSYDNADLRSRQIGPQSKHVLLNTPDDWPGKRPKTVIRVKYCGVGRSLYTLEDDIATIFVTCGLLSDLQRGDARNPR